MRFKIHYTILLIYLSLSQFKGNTGDQLWFLECDESAVNVLNGNDWHTSPPPRSGNFWVIGKSSINKQAGS